MSDFESRYRGVHKRISIIKSGLRLIGCGLAAIVLFSDIVLSLEILIGAFAIAELLGIAEEMI